MKPYVLDAVQDPDRLSSGIRRSNMPFDGRQTARVNRIELDRLLEEDRERAQAEERKKLEDDADRTRVVVRADVLPAIEIQEVTVPMKPVPIPPPPLPQFEARRAARDEARRTKRIVVAIWAFALTLAGSLGYFVASHT